MTGRVAVVGGGLAGIAAALACADAGHAVVLWEGRAHLGGLAGSFRRGGLHVDTGQHVFLRCCHAYRELLERLGVADRVALQDRLDVPVLAPGRRPARLYRTGGPAPLHLAASLARYSPVPLRERVTLLRVATALRRVDPRDPAADAETFGAWLRRHGQRPAAVRALWDLIGTATLNAPAEDASLALAATVFGVGLLDDPTAADIGWARVPLGDLHDRGARAALAAAGVDVRLSTRVEDVGAVGAGWRVTARRRGGASERAEADAVVCAVPPDAAGRVLPGRVGADAAAAAAALGNAPIVDVHVVYDRPVLDVPFAAGVATTAQWLFDRTASSGLGSVHPPGAQYVVVSLSAADAWIGRPTAELRAEFTAELARLLPRARDARVLDAFVTREPHATFRPAPGSAAWRRPARTGHDGLVLAGAWTDTGWPATMEGAVRSGRQAAAELTGAIGQVAA